MKGKNLVLTGFMGSGKTSVGIGLSYRLKMTVEDTDKLIERREGRSINEIFAAFGENYFRQRETQILEELTQIGNGRKIYSLGGGTPVNPQNRELIRRLGTVIWLKVSPGTVYERLKDDQSRPLLAGEHPLERITGLLESRREAYEDCADLIVDVDGKKVEEIVDEIEKKLKEGIKPPVAKGETT